MTGLAINCRKEKIEPRNPQNRTELTSGGAPTNPRKPSI